MYSSGFSSYGLSMVWLHAHFFFGGFAVVGFILLLFWALRNLQKDKLKSAAIWLLVIGILGTLATAPIAAKGWSMMMPGMHGKFGGGVECPFMKQGNSMQSMMDMMMEHNTEDEDEDHDHMIEMMKDMMSPTWHDQDGNVRGGMMMQQ